MSKINQKSCKKKKICKKKTENLKSKNVSKIFELGIKKQEQNIVWRWWVQWSWVFKLQIFPKITKTKFSEFYETYPCKITCVIIEITK